MFVELVESDEHDEHDERTHAAAGETVHGERHPRRRRALWWTGVGVLVLLVGTVAVVNVLEAQRAADRRAELAELPWVLPPMGAELEELWRVDAGWVVGETATAILVAHPASGGVRAVDPLTGEVLWEVPAEGGYCWWAAAMPGMAVTASSDLAAGHDLIVCESVVGPDAEGRTTSTFTSHDAADGRRLATITLEGPIATSMVVGSDYLLVSTLEDGTVVVTLADLLTGGVRWTFRSEPDRDRTLFADYWSVTYDDEVVFIDASEDLVLSRRTGAEVEAEAPPPPMTEAWQLADGGRAVLDYATTSDQLDGRVLNEDGTLRFEFDGWPWAPYGIAGPGMEIGHETLVILQLDGPSASTVDLVGLDPSTGEEVWRRPDETLSQPVLQLDGMGVTASSTEATAIDLRTGEDLWTHPADSTVFFMTPVTDGEVVLLADRSTGTLELVAVDLRTGQDRWRMDAPLGLGDVSASPTGIVLMNAGGELIAYRP